jgi:hypothetical protein
MLCSWCDDAATYHLVADVDSHDNVHLACDAHEAQWGRLYRRSVSVAHHRVVDLRASADDREGRGTVA